MPREFTPAVERALAAAASWSNGSARGEIGPAELLLGLLGEEECRAARMLAACGVNQQRVLVRFPHLKRGDAQQNGLRHSIEVLDAIQQAEERLFELDQPLVLATEHMLLGLTAAKGEVSAWLRERGLDADALEEEIYQLAGHVRGPLPIEPELNVVPLPEVKINRQGQITASEQIGQLRILDAESNRAQEGLRVIEDYVRFALDDRFLTEQVKDTRHRLTSLLAVVPNSHRLAARDSQADVGLRVTIEQGDRTTTMDVVTASFKRVQQALRSLEEYAKPLAPSSAPQLEQIRYATYTLERAVLGVQSASERLAAVRLYVLLDGRESTSDLQRFVSELLDGGADAIQLRDKQLRDRELLERARAVREGTAQHGKLFIMNDRPDLAALARADGVHVGQDELSVKDARSIVGPDMLVGVSTHSIHQARQAVLDGADYIGMGPVFPSGTKKFESYPGLDLIKQVTAEIRLPAFAIGGITLRNVAEVLGAGAQRIAVSGAVSEAADPVSAVRDLRKAISPASTQ